MDLLETVIEAQRVYNGSDVFDVTQNQHLKIKVANDDIFSEQCPQGKAWIVTLTLNIQEEDV